MALWLFLPLLFLVGVPRVASTAKVLVYTATRDFRHDSIPTAVQSLQESGATIDVEFDHTEDESQFSDQNLANYDALLFLSNTGEVLDDPGKAAFQRYLDLGGNFIAIHSASDCLRNTTFYGHEVGAFFDYHPALQNATVDVIDPSHPSTSMLPTAWHVQDEMYNFKSDPRAIGAVVILSANESSYTDDGTRNFDQGTPHPTAWYQERGAGVESNGTAGRSFYTSLGHLNETWEDDLFMSHVLGGISWTLQSNTTRAFNSSAQVGNAQVSVSGDTTASVSSPTSSASPSSSTNSSTTFAAFVNPVSLAVGLLTLAYATFLVGRA